MKQTIAAILLISVFTYSYTQAQDEGNGAVIKFDKTVHDYGVIEKGSDGNCTFTLTNTGESPLIISMCKSSCGCTVPKCPKEPINSGEQRTIKVRYNTNRVGRFTKSIRVTSNATNGIVTLMIKGKVIDPANMPDGPEQQPGLPNNN